MIAQAPGEASITGRAYVVSSYRTSRRRLIARFSFSFLVVQIRIEA